MSSFYGRSGPSELLPRSIFLKPLVTGRRVLELGSASVTGGSTAVALLRLGARTVTAFDEDAAAIERAREEHRGNGVSFRTGRVDELPERSFDLVLLDDAARVVAPGGAGLLGRLLAPHGHLVVPVSNPAGPSLAGLAGAAAAGGPGWAEVTAAVRPLFPSIEVATQQLLVGYVLAPVTGGEARLDIDATAGAAPAAYWLLLCGQRPTGLVDQALVALPPEPLFEAVAARTAAVAPEADRIAALEAERDEAAARAGKAALEVERIAALEAERDEAAARAKRAATDVERFAGRVRELEAEVSAERHRVLELRRAADSAREGLKERETWVDGLRVEVEDREEAESRFQAELKVAQARLVRLEPEHQAAQETLKRVREQLAGKIRELAAAQQAIAERTADLRIAEEELERARAYAQDERKARLAAEAASAGREGAGPAPDAVGEDDAKRIAALEAELAAAKDEGAKRIAGLEAELIAVREDGAKRIAALESLRDEGAKRIAELDEGAKRIAELDELRARIAETEKERDESAEALFAGLAERDRAVLRCAELERALAEAREAKPNEVAANEAHAASAPGTAPADGPAADAELAALRLERDRLAAAVAERDHRLEATQREVIGQADRIARMIAEIAELRARAPRYF